MGGATSCLLETANPRNPSSSDRSLDESTRVLEKDTLEYNNNRM